MDFYTNIHTHIFNLKCVPDRFYGISIVRFLSNNLVSKRICFLLKFLIPLSRKDMFNRVANTLLIGSKKNQDLIFSSLLNAYGHLNMRFVVHSLDMDMMNAGRAANNYESQITQLFEVKKKYLNELLPFLSIDPRKKYPGSLRKYLFDKFTKFGFVGVKLYPALGFYPFDPGLTPLYDFAVKYEIPILVHCTKSGIFYQGKLERQHIYPLNLNPMLHHKHDYSGMSRLKVKEFKNNFTHPANFEDVLSMNKYNTLKICFAHFGGSDEIEKAAQGNKANNFYLEIKRVLMCKDYPNLFTDISYTLSAGDKVIHSILSDIKEPGLRDKILFGTDYYLTNLEKTETKLFDDFIKRIPAHDFKHISVDNCNTFLKSTFYKP